MAGSKKKKTAATAAAAALAAALLIGGTYSYLTANSDLVVNTFNINDVAVDLTESTGEELDYTYDIVPGTSQTKDPYVTVEATTDVYVYVVVTDNTDGLVSYSIADGWEVLYDTDEYAENVTVYYRALTVSEIEALDEAGIQVLTDDTVSYASTITNSDMTTTDADGNTVLKDGITLSFVAYAIQQEPFSTDYSDELSAAQAAFAYANGTSVSVSTASALTAALESDDVTYVTATADIDLTDVIDTSSTSTGTEAAITISSDKTLDLGDYTLAYDTDSIDSSVLEDGTLTQTMVLLSIEEGATLTINSGTYNCDLDYNNSYGIEVVSGDLVINGGTFYGGLTAVQVDDGTATINGGTFIMIDDIRSVQSYYNSYSKYLLNIYDPYVGSSTITITGGTFDGFDPSKDMNGDGAFLASGYTVTSEADEAYSYATWYTVSASE